MRSKRVRVLVAGAVALAIGTYAKAGSSDASALLRAGNALASGPYRQSLQRGLNFILQNVERSPNEGLAITDVTGTQIQRKLGPYIDTFLTSKLRVAKPVSCQ